MRGDPVLFPELSAYYPTTAGLVASTVVARVNGFLGGYGTLDLFEAESAEYGLTPAGLDRIRGLLH